MERREGAGYWLREAVGTEGMRAGDWGRGVCAAGVRALLAAVEREVEAWSQRACATRDPELCPEGYEEPLKGSKEEKRLSHPVFILESCVGHRGERSRSELS